MSPKTSLFILIALCISIRASLAQTAKSTSQRGRISYYSDKFQGKKTASGELFNNSDFTAAHPKLPFNTFIKVTNVANSKSVIVRVNDRGPFTKARILDISKSAAEELGMIKSGTAIVAIEVVGKQAPLTNDHSNEVAIQAEAQQMAETAEKEKRQQETAEQEKRAQQEATKRLEEAHKKLVEESLQAEEEVSQVQESTPLPFAPYKTYSIWGTEKTPAGFGILLASFTDPERAYETAKSMLGLDKHELSIQVTQERGERLYRILAGSFLEKKEARQYQATLEKAGYEGPIEKHVSQLASK